MDAAPAVRNRPTWQTRLWGLRVVDSDRGGAAIVVDTFDGEVPEGLTPGSRILSIDGRSVDRASTVRKRLAAAEEGRVALLWLDEAGERREGPLRARTSPTLIARRTSVAEDAVRTGWAVVDAASSGDRAPGALANLALMLSEYGHHDLAVETWRRVRWERTAGISDGTVQYYLGRDLQRLGREGPAIEAYLAAAKSAATAIDDRGPRVAPAARDHLADLGVSD